MKSQKNLGTDTKLSFDYFTPINRQQKEFIQSTARHKLLIGGYGAGKTYPAIHAALFTCFDNPGHEYLVLKNTWDSLTDDIEQEVLRVVEETHAIKEWDKTAHNLILQSDTVIRFRPLSLGRTKFKGYNICGFLCDDPNVRMHKDVIGFLFTRLRNPPNVAAKYFETIITANYEGHDWLWQTYMRNRAEGGNDKFAYWIIPTNDNPTLSEDFVDDLATIHSESWMKRFVYCDVEHSYTGLVYDEYDHRVHEKDLSWCAKDENLIKIMTIDVGVSDPTVVLKIATDGRNVYVYDEWYYPNVRTNILGEYLKSQIKKENFKALIIDPSSAKRDQNTNRSLQDDLYTNYQIRVTPGNNDILYGVEKVKTLMTIKKNDENGEDETHWFIDPVSCFNTKKEKEIYRWKEPRYSDMSELDELAYEEKPVDKDNHAMDAERYGVCYLLKYLRALFNKEEEIKERRRKLWEARVNKLRMYQNDVKRKRLVEARDIKRIHYFSKANKKYKTQHSRTPTFH